MANPSDSLTNTRVRVEGCSLNYSPQQRKGPDQDLGAPSSEGVAVCNSNFEW